MHVWRLSILASDLWLQHLHNFRRKHAGLVLCCGLWGFHRRQSCEWRRTQGFKGIVVDKVDKVDMCFSPKKGLRLRMPSPVQPPSRQQLPAPVTHCHPPLLRAPCRPLVGPLAHEWLPESAHRLLLQNEIQSSVNRPHSLPRSLTLLGLHQWCWVATKQGGWGESATRRACGRATRGLAGKSGAVPFQQTTAQNES